MESRQDKMDEMLEFVTNLGMVPLKDLIQDLLDKYVPDFPPTKF